MQKSVRLALAGLLFLSGITAANQQEIERNWNRLESGDFTVYTATNESSGALNALEQLQAMRAFVQSSLKIGSIPKFDITVFVFDGGQEFSRYEPHPNTFAFYRKHQAHNYIVVKSFHGGPERALAHEYIHAVFANITPKLPVWLAEGLAEVYSETHKDGSTISFGLAIPDHIARLKSMQPGTVKTIFGESTDTVFADQSSVWNFYALSWSAVHTLVAESKYSGKLLDFVLTMNKTDTEDALGAVYGISTEEFASEVERNIRRASWERLGRAFTCRASSSISVTVVPESKVIALLENISTDRY